ncbi:hypothetical protein GW17_00005655 [Ensete ventricosum]|nr:hypothetical protein GW17_00005655 [Ensete ventricosum]RZR93121.1 hypothetical protein BHM03_00021541 [Ensete ventricosum]
MGGGSKSYGQGSFRRNRSARIAPPSSSAPHPRNNGFAIEDTSYNQASPSTATLGAPSQPRLILPLLPNRDNISSRPLVVVAVDSAAADHIRSRRSTPPAKLLCVESVIPTGKSSPEPTPSSPAIGCNTFRPHNWLQNLGISGLQPQQPNLCFIDKTKHPFLYFLDTNKQLLTPLASIEVLICGRPLSSRRGSTLDVSIDYSRPLSAATSVGLLDVWFLGMNCSQPVSSHPASMAFR